MSTCRRGKRDAKLLTAKDAEKDLVILRRFFKVPDRVERQSNRFLSGSLCSAGKLI